MTSWARLAIAVFAFAVFVALGAFVSHAPAGPLDRSELGAYAEALPLARFFTSVGRFPTYFVLCIAALIFGLVRRAWLRRVLVAVIGIVVVWQTSDLFKNAFHRPRPPHPILAETSFGYPSGHADLAIFFYGLWAYYAWHSGLPRLPRIAVVAALAGWVAAIGWSRLALGAHFPSDVLGGYAYGAGWLVLASGLVSARRNRVAT
jgi:membrane-associated phospholipid phosphatase